MSSREMHIIAIRAKSSSKLEIVKSGCSLSTGVKIANLLFKNYCPQSVSVIKVDANGFSPEDRFQVVYKIHTFCKHSQVQSEMSFYNGSYDRCIACNLVITKVPKITPAIIESLEVSKVEVEV